MYFRDVLDHLITSVEKLDSVRENLVHTHSTYMTKVSMEIASAASRTDAFLHRLAVLATIIAPLALVSAFWGMNGLYLLYTLTPIVPVPGGNSTDLVWYFGIVTGLIVVLMVLVIASNKMLV